MNNKNIITVIDIGSSKIRTVIGFFDTENKNNFHILGIGVALSNAIRKGNILDMEEFMTNLDNSLGEAEKMAGEQIKGAYISFNSSHFDVYKNKGLTSVMGDVTEDDIDRVLDISKNTIDIQNKEILKVVPENFIIDNEVGISNPVGMTAKRIEVSSNIFTINTNVLNNIRNAISEIGISIYDIYPNLISSPEGVLTKRQKELGVVCIDIGASTTGITVFESGTLIHSNIIPIGGDSVSNDIALGLRISTKLSEKIKIDYAELDLENKKGFKDKKLDFKKLNLSDEGEVNLSFLSLMVTARYKQIFQFIRDELKSIGRDGMLPEGAVCVGGGVKIKGFISCAKDSLKLPVFIGLPISKDDLMDASINDPVYTGVIGTMIFANRGEKDQDVLIWNFGAFAESIKKIFKKIIPGL